MNVRTRKFIGVWLLLAVLIVYPIAAAISYSTYLMHLSVWPSLAVFAVAGLFWAVPAGAIIKWMSRPD